MNNPGSVQLNTIWKELWHLRLPGKIKHFGWKVLKGVLPCYGVLAGRHIPLNPQCPMCKIGFEDIQHCLFTCPRALEVWTELGLEEEIDRAVLQDRSGSISLEILVRLRSVRHEIPVAELILVAMWFLWWQRRQCTKGESIQTPEQSAMSIWVLATNFVRAYTPNQPIRKNDHNWKKPTDGAIKVNVDASFHAETLSGACGAIARDDRGNFLAAATCVLPHVSNVHSAELLAVRSGLTLAANLGCTKVIIESDSMVALEAISDPNA